MQVIMAQTAQGAPDGVKVRTYEVGQIYDLPESLAKAFTDMGVADRYRPVSEAETPESPKKRRGDKWNS